MPAHNNFCHQAYTAEPPAFPPVFLTLPPAPSDEEEVRQRMLAVGDCYRAAGVRTIYLVHGTFTGTDAEGMAQLIERLAPAGGEWARRSRKMLVDAVFGDFANFTASYAAELQAALGGEGEAAVPVRLFHWSSQNHHVGRADAAIRLLDELVAQRFAGGRALLWGHSHAGNVFALLTNILGADRECRQQFFDAVAPFYRRGPGRELLDRVMALFENCGPEPERPGCLPQGGPALDIVTLGTPVRYGWDAGGYAKLLHFIYHRRSERCAEYLAEFPFRLDDLLTAAGGDYIQQIGVAGTNFAPHFFAWGAWRAELQLGRLLQPGLRRRDLATRLALGMRIPHEGQTLLVDYGPQGLNFARHIAGHAVYTRREQMLFHAEEVARRFYDFHP